jgi:hypothetical protein
VTVGGKISWPSSGFFFVAADMHVLICRCDGAETVSPMSRSKTYVETAFSSAHDATPRAGARR